MERTQPPPAFQWPCTRFGHFRMARSKTQTGFQHLPCLLGRAWHDGKLELLCPNWEKKLGYSFEELDGRCPCELNRSMEQQPICPFVSKLLANEDDGHPVQLALRTKD